MPASVISVLPLKVLGQLLPLSQTVPGAVAEVLTLAAKRLSAVAEPARMIWALAAAARPAVEALVFEAFKGVTREGGVSWHEAEAIDFQVSDEEWDEARALDTEKSWEELLDDEKWRNQAGEWAWPFLMRSDSGITWPRL